MVSGARVYARSPRNELGVTCPMVGFFDAQIASDFTSNLLLAILNLLANANHLDFSATISTPKFSQVYRQFGCDFSCISDSHSAVLPRFEIAAIVI